MVDQTSKMGFTYMGRADCDSGIGELEDEGDLYQADFPLLDDGCPDSEQHLRVEIEIIDDKFARIYLFALSTNKEKAWPMGDFECTSPGALERVLYGAARLVTTKRFVPK